MPRPHNPRVAAFTPNPSCVAARLLALRVPRSLRLSLKRGPEAILRRRYRLRSGLGNALAWLTLVLTSYEQHLRLSADGL
jgi:hypothetical protein